MERSNVTLPEGKLMNENMQAEEKADDNSLRAYLHS
ncbi:hypothetical protein RCH07_002887 [Arthrobacter sp. CG_A4]|nr:hypothetical protein [Arthrobacter sp. CG_A4]